MFPRHRKLPQTKASKWTRWIQAFAKPAFRILLAINWTSWKEVKRDLLCKRRKFSSDCREKKNSSEFFLKMLSCKTIALNRSVILLKRMIFPFSWVLPGVLSSKIFYESIQLWEWTMSSLPGIWRWGKVRQRL